MQIKLLTLDSSNYMLQDQMQKLDEEHSEIIEAFFNGINLTLAEEVIDLMQACKTLLELMPKDFVYIANENHIAKLKQRAAEGKIKLLEDEE